MGIGGGEHSRLEELLTEEALSHAWRFCCRLSRSREDAQDLLQDALARGLKSIGQLRDPLAFRGWLLSIIHRRFLDLRRTRRNHPEQAGEEAAGIVWQAQAASDDPRAAELAAGLARLPGDQRAALCQHYLDGYSVVELARVYGISKGAMEQRLHRARHALRLLIEEQRDGEENAKR